MFIKSILSGARNVCFKRFSTEFGSSVVTNFLSGADKGIVVIGLNNHKSKNALGKDLTQSLTETIDAISTDPRSRVVIIRSLIPKVFCAGANLKERLHMTESDVRNYVNFLRNLMTKIENIPVPVIAAVDGAALGGGLEMALACDIRVANANAKIGLVETRLAIIPGAGGTQRLPRIIGSALAKELIFTAKILNGKEALQYGLINHCTDNNCEGDSAYQKAVEIARDILPNGPLAIKYAKVAINKGIEVDINKGCAIEELCYGQIIPTKDRLEGLKAFVEKRAPSFTGE